MGADMPVDWPAVVCDAALAMEKATGRSLLDCLTVLAHLANNAEPGGHRPQRTRAIAYLLSTQQVSP